VVEGGADSGGDLVIGFTILWWCLRDDDDDGPDSRLETNAAAADDDDDEELDKGVCTGEPIDQSPTTELELEPAW